MGLTDGRIAAAESRVVSALEIASTMAGCVGAATGISGVWYGWHAKHTAAESNRLAKEALDLARAKRHDELAPVIRPELGNDLGKYRLLLHLDQSPALSRIDVEVVHGTGFEFYSGGGVNGLTAGDVEPLKAWYVPEFVRDGATALREGDFARWPVRLGDDRTDHVVLRVLCSGCGGQEWEQAVRVPLPAKFGFRFLQG